MVAHDTIILIPSRLAATRLPNKPLIPICGTPMIGRVYQQARQSQIGRVVVCAGDQPIVDYITSIGGHAILTDPNLPSGSDRIAAGLQTLPNHEQYKYIINLQGDLPTIDPKILQNIHHAMVNNRADITTAVVPMTNPTDIHNPNIVKAVCEFNGAVGRAIYFSRNPVPWRADSQNPYYHHLGIYGYQRQSLLQYVALPPAQIELMEKLEQLRALANGMSMQAIIEATIPLSVDTADDLVKVEQFLNGEG